MMKLSILFFNDVHGYLQPHAELFYEGGKEVIKSVGGYERIAGYIQHVRAKHNHVLVFDGGDTFHGTLPVVQSKGEAVVPILYDLHIDAMVGHWDFAYGPQQLKHLAAQLNYPLLGINVYNNDGSLFLEPYIIKQVANCKVAIIGICSNIIDKTMPKQFSEGLKITDGSEELPTYIEKVKAAGADIVILLSHNGFPQDYALLSEMPGIDICLSAHTHNRLYEAIIVNKAIIIQCGCHGSFLGHLDIEWDNNKIQSWAYELKAVDESMPQCDQTIAKVKEAIAPFRPLMNDIVGSTPLTLHRYNTLNSGMDNFLLASMQWQTGTDLAFSNGWRYGIPIPRGKITRYDLFNIIPHNPTIETTELTGEQIRLMLEENLERTFSSNAMHQMGGYIKRCMGLTAYIKIENPKYHRIQELYIGDKKYQKDKLFTASFVTEQGVPKKYGIHRTKTGTPIIDAITAFLKADLLNENIIENKAIVSV
jgi:S-sulfosulfanyl-L-cysteine sulfohydrolase